MATDPHVHPVYTSINKPLTIWGAERRLFLVALILGAAVFNLFGSLPGGVLIFGLLYVGARVATATDPQILRILLSSSRVGHQYDPITFAPLVVRRSQSHADPVPRP